MGPQGPSIWGAHSLMREADTWADDVSNTGSVFGQRCRKGTERRGSGKSPHRNDFADLLYRDCKVRRLT